MAEEAPVEFRVDEFKGQASNWNKHRQPPGVSVEQVNCGSPKAGELAVREGFRPVTFD